MQLLPNASRKHFALPAHHAVAFSARFLIACVGVNTVAFLVFSSLAVLWKLRERMFAQWDTSAKNRVDVDQLLAVPGAFYLRNQIHSGITTIPKVKTISKRNINCLESEHNIKTQQK